MNYVYIQSEHGDNGLWTVGFYDPDGKWQPESDHSSGLIDGVYQEGAEAAAARVHYLNGGSSPETVLLEALITQLRQDKAELVAAAQKVTNAYACKIGERCPRCELVEVIAKVGKES